MCGRRKKGYIRSWGQDRDKGTLNAWLFINSVFVDKTSDQSKLSPFNIWPEMRSAVWRAWHLIACSYDSWFKYHFSSCHPVHFLPERLGELVSEGLRVRGCFCLKTRIDVAPPFFLPCPSRPPPPRPLFAGHVVTNWSPRPYQFFSQLDADCKERGDRLLRRHVT